MALVVGCFAIILLTGFRLTRLPSVRVARTLSWLLVVLSVITVERLVANEPAGVRMVSIILALLYSLKSLVTIESNCKPPLSLSVWLGFSMGWFGMRPKLFVRVPAISNRSTSRLQLAMPLIQNGLLRFIIGSVFLVFARIVWHSEGLPLDDVSRRLLVTALLLPGLSLMVHFGLFNILAGVWNGLGARCKPLFRAPLLSKSLTEFWGQRWNAAFSEMTALVVFRPLQPWLGSRLATTIAFLFSGLLHELAISVPVQQGFGLPLIYFVLHAIAMSLEARWKNCWVLTNNIASRVWTCCWMIVPLPLLFHEAFLAGCV